MSLVKRNVYKKLNNSGQLLNGWLYAKVNLQKIVVLFQIFIGHIVYATQAVDNNKENISSLLKSQDASTPNKVVFSLEPIATNAISQWLIGFLSVIGIIIFLAYILKKQYLPINYHKHLKVIAWLAVGQKANIALVQVGDQQLLIGITQNNISLLQLVDSPVPITGNNFKEFKNYLPSY